MKKSLLSQVMSELAKIKTPARAAAARENGKKGGRPHKIKTNESSIYNEASS